MLQGHCANSSVTYHVSAVTAAVTTGTVMFGHRWKMPEAYIYTLNHKKRDIFTVLHVMQTRYCDENSVCPSVRPSHACNVTKR